MLLAVATLAFAGIGAAALMGCRDLVLPEPGPDPTKPAAGQVFTPSGEPAIGVYVNLTRYTEGGQIVASWSGYADELGRFKSDLPTPGEYEATVSYQASYFERAWYFGLITFAGEVVELRPQPVTQPARLVLPQALMSSLVDADGSIYYLRRVGFFQRETAVDFQATSNGDFTIYAPYVGRYRIRFWLDQRHSQLILSPPDSVAVTGGDTLLFAPAVARFELVPTLRGEALLSPLSHIDADVSAPTGTSDFEIDALTGGAPVQLWAYPGVVRLRLFVGQSAPYSSRQVYADIWDGLSINVEMGPQLLDVTVMTTSGAPVAAAPVRTRAAADSADILLTTDTEGRVSFYLFPGSYAVTTAAGAGASRSIELAGDASIVLTIPDPAP